jgi:hypothetical protein
MADQDADIELCAKALIGVLKLAPPEKRAAVLACLVRQCAEGALRDRVAPPRLVQPPETEDERRRRELDEFANGDDTPPPPDKCKPRRVQQPGIMPG